MLMTQVAVMEMSPKLRDEQDDSKVVSGSEIPAPLPTSNELVERNPDGTAIVINDASTCRIAWRDLKVKVGKIFKGKSVKWTMTPKFTPSEEYWPGAPYASSYLSLRPVVTGPTFRGDWNDVELPAHRNRFSASYAYPGPPITHEGESATSLVNDLGYTSIRVNVPPIGFNKARITIKIKVTSTEEVEIDLLDLEVPAIVVIDPGHGGIKNESGSDANHAKSFTNRLEKNMTLAVSREIRSGLHDMSSRKSCALRVVMTRTDDYNLSGPARSRLSGEHGADQFMSIHFNGDDSNASIRGSEAWIYPSGPPQGGCHSEYDSSLRRQINFQQDADFANRILNAVVRVIPNGIRRGDGVKEYDLSTKKIDGVSVK